jgi:hypothetical protein
MRAKEHHEHFNINLMQSLDIIDKKIDKETNSSKYGSHRSHDETRRTRSVGRNHQHSQRYSTRRAHSSPSTSPVKKHMKKSGVDELEGEMKKIKPPTFYGEHKNDDNAETWLLGMRKYFQLHNYSSQAEGRISIYRLKGKASMWWYQFVLMQHIDEKNVTWREFKRYFQNKYLTKRYYDKKMKEFFELKLRSMTIDKYERRFLELLKYISFIKDEKVNIQRYLSGIPSPISDKIQYDDPNTLEETIRRTKCLYDLLKGRATYQKPWENKMNSKMEHIGWCSWLQEIKRKLMRWLRHARWT